MSEDSSQKYPDGFVSICTVPREIGKILYADRWSDIAKSLQKRDDLSQEYAAALEDGADTAAVASILSRLSAAKAAVRPGWVRHLMEADRLMTSDALPLYRYRRGDLPHPVAKDSFAGVTDQHVRTRQLMLLTGKFASDLVIVLERDLRGALQHLQYPIEKREHAIKEVEKAYRAAAEDHQWKPKGLTPQQESALNKLDDAVDVMRQWRGITPENDFEERLLLADQDEYEKALTQAIQADLWHHPIVRDWLAARRSLGDWDELRRFRKKLETGVKKPMSKANSWLSFVAADLIKNGSKPEAICKILIEKLKDPEPEGWDKKGRDYFDLHPEDVEHLTARLERSRQNFHKWLKRLRLI